MATSEAREVGSSQETADTTTQEAEEEKTIEEILSELRRSADPITRTLLIITEQRLRRVRMGGQFASESDASSGENTCKVDGLCPPSVSETVQWTPAIAQAVAEQQRFCDRVRPRGRGAGRGRGRKGRRLVSFS